MTRLDHPSRRVFILVVRHGSKGAIVPLLGRELLRPCVVQGALDAIGDGPVFHVLGFGFVSAWPWMLKPGGALGHIPWPLPSFAALIGDCIAFRREQTTMEPLDHG